MHALALCAALAAQAPTSPATAPSAAPITRVFFSQLENGGGVSADEVALLSDALLVEARRYSDRYQVIGRGELEHILDVEASRRALGCDDTACASEVADALDAPQLVTGKVGRLGNTWILSLTRIERATATALDRAQAQKQGDGVDALLPALPGLIDEVFRHGAPAPIADPSDLPMTTVLGIGGAVLGGVGLAAAGGLYLAAKAQLDEGLKQVAVEERQRYKAVGEPLYYGSMAALGVGVVGVAAGGALLVFGALDSPE